MLPLSVSDTRSSKGTSRCDSTLAYHEDFTAIYQMFIPSLRMHSTRVISAGQITEPQRWWNNKWMIVHDNVQITISKSWSDNVALGWYQSKISYFLEHMRTLFLKLISKSRTITHELANFLWRGRYTKYFKAL